MSEQELPDIYMQEDNPVTEEVEMEVTGRGARNFFFGSCHDFIEFIIIHFVVITDLFRSLCRVQQRQRIAHDAYGPGHRYPRLMSEQELPDIYMQEDNPAMISLSSSSSISS
jgi:hypothetical protein